MSNRSSQKQQQLLEFIDDFITQHGYGPSYREIMSGLGYKSVSTVAVHVNGLLAKGYIRKKDNSARSIEIVSLRHDEVSAAPKVVIATPKQAPAQPQSELPKLLAEKIRSLQASELDLEDEAVLLRALELVDGEKEASQLRDTSTNID